MWCSWALFSVLFLSRTALAAEDAFDLPEPPAAALAHPRALWATYYHVYALRETSVGFPYRDARGIPITGNISAEDWCRGAIEGTVTIQAEQQTRTLNYAGLLQFQQVDCAAALHFHPPFEAWITRLGRSSFAAARGPYGDGVDDLLLVPMRSIAVDRNAIPIKSIIYVPSARGLLFTLANGQVLKHDGYFFAADTGGGIKGNHIDVFCGDAKANCLPDVAQSESSSTFPAYLIASTAIYEKLLAEHTNR